jgi:hypothetical protein
MSAWESDALATPRAAAGCKQSAFLDPLRRGVYWQARRERDRDSDSDSDSKRNRELLDLFRLGFTGRPAPPWGGRGASPERTRARARRALWLAQFDLCCWAGGACFAGGAAF